MKQKILKLIKRLSRFTIDDIAIMSEYDEKALVPVIDNFEDVLKENMDSYYENYVERERDSSLDSDSDDFMGD